MRPNIWSGKEERITAIMLWRTKKHTHTHTQRIYYFAHCFPQSNLVVIFIIVAPSYSFVIVVADVHHDDDFSLHKFFYIFLIAKFNFSLLNKKKYEKKKKIFQSHFFFS